jgi:60 kDa SS-A/Ro ribonucleoprotein
MVYGFFTKGNKTPQNQPIPGRAQEMVKGRSGGYGFKPKSWQMLQRCLMLGTANNTYYANKHELTNEFTTIVMKCVADNPARTAQVILAASDGKAINNSAPILALTLLSMGESPAAKAAFLATFPKVVRTGNHFYEWLNYTKSLRGFGKVVREAGRTWLSKPDAKALAYQLLKYQQRHGFSHRDALRLFHAKPISESHQDLYNWVVKGWDSLPEQPTSEVMQQIWWYEWVKRNPAQTHEAIAKGRLTHEMVAPVGQMDEPAWQLLFMEMPVGAMLRNLASLTEIGVLAVGKRENLDHLAKVLNSKEKLRKARIHPIDVLKALKTYRSAGTLGRSRKTWQVVPRVVDILENMLELSFDSLEPTGKTFLHAVDVSGSMSYSAVASIGLTCCEIATTMALASAKAEKNYAIRGFADSFRDLKITAKDSFSSAMKKASHQNFGATDAAVAYQWAIKERLFVDVFCFWTDSESWAGHQHPSQALAEYRRQVNPTAKAVYFTLAPGNMSLVDPKDSMSWDFGGFDPSAPRVVQMIALGEV